LIDPCPIPKNFFVRQFHFSPAKGTAAISRPGAGRGARRQKNPQGQNPIRRTGIRSFKKAWAEGTIQTGRGFESLRPWIFQQTAAVDVFSTSQFSRRSRIARRQFQEFIASGRHAPVFNVQKPYGGKILSVHLRGPAGMNVAHGRCCGAGHGFDRRVHNTSGHGWLRNFQHGPAPLHCMGGVHRADSWLGQSGQGAIILIGNQFGQAG